MNGDEILISGLQSIGLTRELAERCLVSHDAILSVIAKQERGCKTALLYWLNDDPWTADKIVDTILEATPRQLCVALLKARGRWKE
jgi:hypothetical protein